MPNELTCSPFTHQVDRLISVMNLKLTSTSGQVSMPRYTPLFTSRNTLTITASPVMPLQQLSKGSRWLTSPTLLPTAPDDSSLFSCLVIIFFRIGAVRFFEVSAFTQKNLKDLFDEAVRVFRSVPHKEDKKKKTSGGCILQ